MLLFSILIYFVDIRIATGAGLLMSFLGTTFIKRHSRMIYDLSGITFLISLMFQVLYPTLDTFATFTLTEMIFVFSLIISRLTRSKVIHRLARKSAIEVRNYLSESFRVGFQVQYALFVHLLMVLFYLLIVEIKTPLFSTTHLLIIMQIGLVVIIAIEVIRLRILDHKLRNEDWLPVINESGDVKGRVAKSVTQQLKNRHLHPVVRIALINKGKLYLSHRPANRILNPGMLDYPFEKYMRYSHDIGKTVENIISKVTGKKDMPYQFALKYVFENESTRRLVLLYVSVINDDDKFASLQLPEGKLWTVGQIEENRGQGLFSETFEQEFEYLKNTILLQNLPSSNGAN